MPGAGAPGAGGAPVAAHLPRSGRLPKLGITRPSRAEPFRAEPCLGQGSPPRSRPRGGAARPSRTPRLGSAQRRAPGCPFGGALGEQRGFPAAESPGRDGTELWGKGTGPAPPAAPLWPGQLKRHTKLSPSHPPLPLCPQSSLPSPRAPPTLLSHGSSRL